mgnify:FL=1|jgi:hypothetical protein|tara:strand:- start:3326 stop:4075 length:750 start_codon:yes stop_codon:yes gene_type:complete
MARKFPVFIIVRDRVSPLGQLVTWLESTRRAEIWLIDNDSTYPPLLRYLDKSPHHVMRLSHNLGHRSPWLSGAVQRNARGRHYIVSDADVVPDAGCPTDALDRFNRLLRRYRDIDKVGFGLRIDDLPEHYPHRDHVFEWEQRFWREEVEPGAFRAEIDTTFAMYREPGTPDHQRALRTGLPYVARHTPWYVDPNDLSEEDKYYRHHADPTISNWDQDRLPLWKQRWLKIFEDIDQERNAATEHHSQQDA